MNSTNVASTIVKSNFDSDLLPDTILTSQTSDVSLADLNDFLLYLKRVCAFILDLTSFNLIDIDRFFADQSSHLSIERFISDGQCQVLFVSKINPSTEYLTLIQRDVSVDVPRTTTATSSSSSLSFHLYAFSNEIQKINPKCLSLVVLKRGSTIVNDTNYHVQLEIISFIDPKQHEGLFDRLLDGQRIHLPEIVLSTHVLPAQNVQSLIDNVITQGSITNKNNGQNHQQTEDEDDMVFYHFSFTNALDNYNRARVYDAILAFSVRTTAENRAKAPCHIRRIADENYIFQAGEEFGIVFQAQISYLGFHVWLNRSYSGSHHVLTLIEPATYAMKIIV